MAPFRAVAAVVVMVTVPCSMTTPKSSNRGWTVACGEKCTAAHWLAAITSFLCTTTTKRSYSFHGLYSVF